MIAAVLVRRVAEVTRVLACASVLAFPVHAAEPEPLHPHSHAMAASGPLSLALAAEPGGVHWAFESGMPLSFRPRGADTPWRVEAALRVAHSRGDAAVGNGLGGALRFTRVSAASAWWWGLARGGARATLDPHQRLQLGFGRQGRMGALHSEWAFVASSVLFRDDPRWSAGRTFRYFVPFDTGGGMWRDSTETGERDHNAFWYTPQATLRWQAGRIALHTVAGLSLGEGVTARRWAQATLEYQWSRRVRIAASLGERPSAALAFANEAAPRTMLGVRVAPWAERGWALGGEAAPRATQWRAQAVGEGRLLVRVQARGASRVEVAGDFSDWQPLELPAVHGGWWAGVIRVPPGVHRVQLRLDGGRWCAPPGLPQADAEFSGPAGTLVVPGP